MTDVSRACDGSGGSVLTRDDAVAVDDDDDVDDIDDVDDVVDDDGAGVSRNQTCDLDCSNCCGGHEHACAGEADYFGAARSAAMCMRDAEASGDGSIFGTSAESSSRPRSNACASSNVDGGAGA